MIVKRICALLLAFVLLITTGAASVTATPQNGTKMPSLSSLRHIPGVTAEQVEQIELLREKYSGELVYGMNASMEAFVAEDGSVQGFSAEMCKWMSELFGLTIVPKIYEFEDLVAGMLNGEITFSGDLNQTPEREGTYFMTEPIVDRVINIVCLEKNAGTTYYDQMPTIAIFEGSATYQLMLNSPRFNFTPAFINSYEEALSGVQKGRFDGFAIESSMLFGLEQYEGLVERALTPVLFSSVSLSTANPDFEVIIDVVQKYMNWDTTYSQLNKMYQDGMKQYSIMQFNQMLTPQEQDYISRHIAAGVPVRMVAKIANYPISFYNTHTEKWEGVAHDILAEISEVSGLKFQVANLPTQTWGEEYEMLKSGFVEMSTSLIYSNERAQHFIWSDESYAYDNMAFLSLDTLDYLSVNQIRTKTVATVAKSIYESEFKASFPNHKHFVTYPTSIECIDALLRGDVDLVFIASKKVLWATNYKEKNNVKVNLTFNSHANSSFAFRAEETLLCSIVSKAQSVVNCDNINNRWQVKSYDYASEELKLVIQRVTLIAVGLMVVIVGLILLFKHRERGIKQMGMTDYLTGLPNKRSFMNAINAEWKNAKRSKSRLSLLTIDIDFFKRYNDTYGHPQGDTLLRYFAGILKSSIHRKCDIAARVGGEEFVILLPDTDLKSATIIAENIRQRTQEMLVPTAEGGATHVTVSVGVAEARPYWGYRLSIDQFIQISDDALYDAKNSGRNCVRTAHIKMHEND